MAELYGIWKGMELCVTNNFMQVEVESDSKVALDLIQQKNHQWNWQLHNILTRISNLTSNLNVLFLHLYMEGNSAETG